MFKRFVILSALFAACLAVLAEQPMNSVQVRGMGWGTCPPAVVLHAGDYWGGEVYLTLNGQELLVGVWSGQDGETIWAGPDEWYGQGKNGIYTYGFNKQADGSYKDMLVTHIHFATFPLPMGLMGFGTYTGTHKIVSGTGRFKNASGVIQVTGTWMDSGTAGSGAPYFGRFAPEYVGFINNIEPKE